MKLKKSLWLAIWGTLWIFAGFSLLRKGLYLLTMVEEVASNEKNTLVLVSIATFLGILKGRVFITKAAKRIIQQMPVDQIQVSYRQAIPLRGLAVMALMMGMGFVLNVVNINSSIRGFIDTVIGAALLQGSMTFFKEIYAKKEKVSISK